MLLSLSGFTPAVLCYRISPFLFPLGLALLSIVSLHHYFSGTTTLLLAGMAAVASTTRKGRPVKTRRFAAGAIVLLMFTWLVPVNTLLFFAVALAFFYWVEVYWGAVHFLALVALFISSPAFQNASNAFSFPVRLQLTKLVAAVYSLAGSAIKFNGNVISFKGAEFSVDPACAGLHMFSLSILSGICLLGLLQRKLNRQLSRKMTVVYLLCLCVFTLLANVLRIVLLVQFAVPAEAAMHEVIGLLCLLLYVCLPACYVAKTLVSKAARGKEAVQPRPHKPTALLQWTLMAALLVTAQRVATMDTYARFETKYARTVDGFASSVYAPGILKLQNERALVYVKFIRGFYDTEHNPTMCWTGSGYELKDVKKGAEMYTARLEKAGGRLYTAWWYGNGKNATASQWEWRWNMLHGSDGYAVINVTASTEAALAAEVKKILQEQALSPLFKNGM